MESKDERDDVTINPISIHEPPMSHKHAQSKNARKRAAKKAKQEEDTSFRKTWTTSTLAFRPKAIRKATRVMFTGQEQSIEDLGQLEGIDMAQLERWIKMRNTHKATWKGVVEDFSTFLLIPNYYFAWKRAFHEKNRHLFDLSQNELAAYFARTVVYYWRRWAITSEERHEVFAKHEWECDKEGRRNVLGMVLKQVRIQNSISIFR